VCLGLQDVGRLQWPEARWRVPASSMGAIGSALSSCRASRTVTPRRLTTAGKCSCCLFRALESGRVVRVPRVRLLRCWAVPLRVRNPQAATHWAGGCSARLAHSASQSISLSAGPVSLRVPIPLPPLRDCRWAKQWRGVPLHSVRGIFPECVSLVNSPASHACVEHYVWRVPASAPAWWQQNEARRQPGHCGRSAVESRRCLAHGQCRPKVAEYSDRLSRSSSSIHGGAHFDGTSSFVGGWL